MSILWLTLRAFNQVRINESVWRRGRWALLMLVLVQLWTFFQLIPLPRALLAVLSPQANAWHVTEDAATLSLDPAATLHYLLVGCAITQGFFLALALINSHARVKTLLTVLVLCGVFQAAYGAFMVLSGLEIGFFVEKYAGLGVATGTFINRNHLAGYLVMCLAAGIGLLLSQLRSSGESTWRGKMREWLKFMLSPKMRLRLYLAVMVIALVLTRSRMGNVAFFVSLSIGGLVALYAGRRFSFRLAGLLASLFLIDMLILSRWFGFDRLMARFEQMEGQPVEAEGRYWLDQFSWDYVRDFPLTGSGGGSFYGIFPNYQGPQLRGYYEHVHNDYLEFAAELGMPALLVLATFLLYCLWQAVWVQRERLTPLYRGLGFAATMSICWCLLHSTADFNLQIPANAYTLVVILAAAVVCRGLPSRRS
ncbi:MAG: O-antigen ligase family protein [Halioglobus sp.]